MATSNYANDMKARIRSAAAGKYPDLIAPCGGHPFQDSRQNILFNPSLIVEVLPDSTDTYDRGDKFALYRQIGGQAGFSSPFRQPFAFSVATWCPGGATLSLLSHDWISYLHALYKVTA